MPTRVTRKTDSITTIDSLPQPVKRDTGRVRIRFQKVSSKNPIFSDTLDAISNVITKPLGYKVKEYYNQDGEKEVKTITSLQKKAGKHAGTPLEKFLNVEDGIDRISAKVAELVDRVVNAGGFFGVPGRVLALTLATIARVVTFVALNAILFAAASAAAGVIVSLLTATAASIIVLTTVLTVTAEITTPLWAPFAAVMVFKLYKQVQELEKRLDGQPIQDKNPRVIESKVDKFALDTTLIIDEGSDDEEIEEAPLHRKSAKDNKNDVKNDEGGMVEEPIPSPQFDGVDKDEIKVKDPVKTIVEIAKTEDKKNQ
ncbi:MAG: hypothetical protein L0207_06175 [Chlamydiae bacterium]|nr:hypothetical protein [Chlamydiota bacterium]